MTLDEFTGKFAEMFDETDPAEITSATRFKELEEWTSLMALTTICMIDDEYEVVLKGDDIRNSSTVEDLYKVVESKL